MKLTNFQRQCLATMASIQDSEFELKSNSINTSFFMALKAPVYFFIYFEKECVYLSGEKFENDIESFNEKIQYILNKEKIEWQKEVKTFNEV
jgi:hypothetical protein